MNLAGSGPAVDHRMPGHLLIDASVLGGCLGCDTRFEWQFKKEVFANVSMSMARRTTDQVIAVLSRERWFDTGCSFAHVGTRYNVTFKAFSWLEAPV